MRGKGDDHPLIDYYLFPGELYLSHDPSLVSVVLGSGVAVSIWHNEKLFGGMAHFLYPNTIERRKATVHYGNVAVKALLKRFLDEGAQPKNLKAQIFGGALHGSLESARIAKDSVQVARMELTSQRIRILSDDTGGYMGRKIVYNTNTNESLVYRANTLRKSDWYPYHDEE